MLLMYQVTFNESHHMVKIFMLGLCAALDHWMALFFQPWNGTADCLEKGQTDEHSHPLTIYFYSHVFSPRESGKHFATH